MVFERALRRELSRAAIGIFAALFAILLATQLVRLLNDASGGRVAPEAVAALLGFTALQYLSTLLSLTLFITILATLSRQYRDSEMVIWFVSGNSIFAWIPPILRFSVPVAIVVALLSFVVTPWGLQKSSEYRQKANSRSESTYISPGVFRESDGSNRVVFVESIDDQKAGIKGVFVREADDQRLTVVTAAEGRKQTMENGDRFLVLERGRRYDVLSGTTELRAVEFGRYAVRIELKESYQPVASIRESTTSALAASREPKAKAELAWRAGLPISVLLLSLLAIPLAYVNPRGGRSWGVVAALLVFLIYNNMQSVVQSWIAAGKVPALAGFLAVHLTTLGVFVVLAWRQSRARKR